MTANTLLTMLGGWLGQALLYGTLLAGLTWVLLRCGGLQRRRPALAAVLWTIVLVKFVLPVGPATGFSLATLVERMAPGRSPVASALLPTAPSINDGAWIPVETGTTTPSSARVDTPPVAPAASLAINAGRVLALAYLLIVAALGIRQVRRGRALRRHCTTLPPAGERVRAVVRAAAKTLGLRRLPDVRIDTQPPAPYVLGVLRPVLVLAERHLDSPRELEAVVLHELAHLHRNDLAIALLQRIAGTLLFFWPVVAWVNRRLDLARESACDEWALRHASLSPTEYARCLLRAAQPSTVDGARGVAAMAASISHVERRIEMILSQDSRQRLRRAGFASAGIVIAWATFVLAGAATPDNGAPETEQKEVRVEVQRLPDGSLIVHKFVDGQEVPAGDEEVHTLQAGDGPHMAIFQSESGDATPLMIAATDVDSQPIWMAQASDDGSEQNVMMIRVETRDEPGAFLADHPTADANGDGNVSRSERDAYLTAVALLAPQQVLAQYPDADRDGDGALSAREAARVAINAPLLDRLRDKQLDPAAMPGAQVRRTETTEELPGNDGETKIQRRIEVIRSTASADAVAGPLPPARWLLDNIAQTPTAAQVAAQVPVAEAAPNALFLELNPSADADRDGVLTQRERERYLDKMQSGARQRFLERHPEADTNADGILSPEEFRAALGGIEARAGEKVHVIRERAGNGDGAKQIQVWVEQEDEADK